MNENESRFVAKFEEINLLLCENSVPIDKWGKDSAKTIDHLVSEIEEGTTKIYVNERREVIRQLNVVGVNVMFVDNNGDKIFASRRKTRV